MTRLRRQIADECATRRLTLSTAAFALCVVALALLSGKIEDSVAPRASVNKLIGN